MVIFHGFKSGKELDEIYNNSDIGLGHWLVLNKEQIQEAR